MKTILYSFVFMATLLGFSQKLPYLQDVQHLHSVDLKISEAAAQIKYDKDNNLIVALQSTDTLITKKQNGVDSTFCAAPSKTSCIFLIKYNQKKEVIWMKFIDTGFSDYRLSMDLDSEGNIYISSAIIPSSKDSVDLNPDPFKENWCSQKLSPYGAGFLAKYTTNGDYVWHVLFDADLGVAIDHIAVSQNKIFVGGYFNGNARTIFANDTISYSKTPSTAGDGYIFQLDTAGNYQWHQLLTGTGMARVQKISVTHNNEVYIAGDYNKVLTYQLKDSIIQKSTSSPNNIYLAKLDSLGKFEWFNTFEGSGKERVDGIVAVDDYIYFSGEYSIDIQLNPSQNYSSISEFNKGFLAKFSSTGLLNWSFVFNPEKTIDVGTLKVDNNQNLYIIGDMYDTLFYDPMYSNKYLIDNNDIHFPTRMILKYTPTGKNIWAYTVDCNRSLYLQDIAVNSTGEISLFGSFSSPVDLDVQLSTEKWLSPYQSDPISEDEDVFIATYAQSNLGLQRQQKSSSTFTTQLFPNPASTSAVLQFTSSSVAEVTIELMDIQGRLITRLFTGIPNGTLSIPINMSDLEAACYLVQIEQGGERQLMRLVKN